MDRKLKIGIIGTGGIAGAHMNGYSKFNDVEVVAGCDIVPGKAREFLDKRNLPQAAAFESADEMLAKVELDGVSVCTYNTTHAVCAIAALNAGVHVLCEKPMSFHLDEAVEMLRAQKKSGKILTIGFQPRYGRIAKAVKEIIDAGELGKIYYTQSGGGRRFGIPGKTFVKAEYAGFGCLGDIGCYSIDECLAPLHYPKPLTVSAMATDYFGKNPKYWPDYENFNVDDFSTAFVRCEGGLTFIFKQSWAMHADTLGDTLWLGTEGGLKLLNGPKYDGPHRLVLFNSAGGKMRDTYVMPTYDVNHIWTDLTGDEDVFTMKMRDFCDAIIENRPSPIPASEIIRNQAICDGIYRSSKLGEEVKIEIPEV